MLLMVVTLTLVQLVVVFTYDGLEISPIQSSTFLVNKDLAPMSVPLLMFILLVLQ